MTKRKADASPRKAFFVSMLTRDITLEDCILDLIDNSIDAAWQSSGERPTTLISDEALADFEIEIEFDGKTFRISDNCTGIELDDAIDYAFTFGRSDEQEFEAYSVGVYGIGMKRAVFKLGTSVRVTSTFENSDKSLEAFSVPINVEEWLADRDNWDFDIDDAEPDPTVGVTITVDDLREDTRELLGDATYERRLRRILSRDYMIPLMRGLVLKVNGTEVTTRTVELRSNEQFEPMRMRYEDSRVVVEIVAGMMSSPPDDLGPDEQREDDPSGWYVACNGRMVLASDRTHLTGWGERLPRWHRQYSGFVGLAFFSSEDSLLLPMTTTKRSVDASSGVYRRALEKMFEPSRAWIDYTNIRKNDLDNMKSLEDSAKPADLVSVPSRDSVALPTIAKRRPREKEANVNYAVPLTKMRLLAEAFGDRKMSYRDVGLHSFEYTFDDLVDEDD